MLILLQFPDFAIPVLFKSTLGYEDKFPIIFAPNVNTKYVQNRARNRRNLKSIKKKSSSYDKLGLFCSPSITGDTRGVQKCLEGSKTGLECSRRSQIITGVIGSTNAIGLMMRWSAQLLLTEEDHHFEGSMLPKPTSVLDP